MAAPVWFGHVGKWAGLCLLEEGRTPGPTPAIMAMGLAVDILDRWDAREKRRAVGCISMMPRELIDYIYYLARIIKLLRVTDLAIDG